MAREWAYRVDRSPEGSQDGAGKVLHDLWSVYTDDAWVTELTLPGYHKSLPLDADDVEVVMDMPDSTGPERGLKITAYKNLMSAHINDGSYSAPPQDWQEAHMQAVSEANDNAVLQAGRVDTFVTVTLGQTYPVRFNL